MAAKKTRSGYDGKIAGLYDLEETIGHGHFAVVKLARHVFTGEKVAVKVIDKQKLDEISRSHLFQEVRCMKLVQHPNVVRLYEVIDTQTKLYLILELGDGDMYDYIMKHDEGLDEALAKKYFRQIVEAITYCHRLHVVHRDLKPENVVFFDKLGVVKLTDFGFSNVFAPGKKLETSCGSLAYSAPEILLGDSYDPPAVDVWSLGVILFMLVAGHAPFQEANDSETLTMIMDCKYQIPPHVSDMCRRLISKMLVRDPAQRINLTDIEKDAWLLEEEGMEETERLTLPLLSRELVSEEDHNYVVQKMVEGKICTREEIFQSLEMDAYDHIAATYYLLVERRLKKIQQQEAAALAQSMGLRKQSAPSPAHSDGKPHLEPLMLSPRKRKEMKKTKTAPIHKTVALPPTLVITPPIVGDSSSQEGSGGVSPGGPDFVKSLTTSMTLDRRSSHRKKQQQVSGIISPLSCGATSSLEETDRSQKIEPDIPKKGVGQQRVKSAPLTQEGLALTNPGKKKKKSGAPSFSKIAILSSFFERKAAEESGQLQPFQAHQRLFPWAVGTSGGKERKSEQRPILSPNSPCDPEPLVSSIKLRVQSAGPEHSDQSSLVQSLVSPPGTRPTQAGASSPQFSQHLTPEAAFSAMRKCSLIREESQDEEEDDFDDFDMDSTELKPSKSLEFLDERTSELSPAAGQELGLSPKVSSGSTNIPAEPVNPRRPLKSVCSSPQLLNQIHEENESEDEDDFVPLKLSAPRGRYSHSGLASPEILRKYEQRRRRRGAGQRGTSCSSSDASDTDDTEGRSRKDKLKHKFVHRRDSSDHSSDTDGPSGGNLGGGGHIGNSGGGGGNSKTYSRSRRDGGGGGGGGGNNGGGGGGGDKGGKNHQNNKHHQHKVYSSDSKSSIEDLADVREQEHMNLPLTEQCVSFIIGEENEFMCNNQANSSCDRVLKGMGGKRQLTRQKQVNSIESNALAPIDTNFDLVTLSYKLSAISSSSISSGEGSIQPPTINNNKPASVNKNSSPQHLSDCLSTFLVSPAPASQQYIGFKSCPHGDSCSMDSSLDFSHISDYRDLLFEEGPGKISCSGDCGLASSTPHHLASQASPSSVPSSLHNGYPGHTIAPAFCKVGSGAPVVQVESKCCSVV